jgi:hypothetical protein
VIEVTEHSSCTLCDEKDETFHDIPCEPNLEQYTCASVVQTAPEPAGDDDVHVLRLMESTESSLGYCTVDFEIKLMTIIVVTPRF